MKFFIISLLVSLSMSNAFSKEFRLVDQKGLLKPINEQLLSKTINDLFSKGDEAQVLTHEGKLEKLVTTKANSKAFVIKKPKSLKQGSSLSASAEEFKKFNSNMMMVFLKNTNYKVTINGAVFENTFLVRSVKKVNHTLDNGDAFNAYQIEVTSADTEFAVLGWSPSIVLKFVLAPDAPGIAQILKVNFNGTDFFNVRSFTKR